MTTTNQHWYERNDKKQRKTFDKLVKEVLSRFLIVSVYLGREEYTHHYRFEVILKEKE